MKLEPTHGICHVHPRCHVYWRPDPARNRLRGRAVHVSAWVLFDGTPGDEVMVKLPNVTVRGPIFWDKEELRRARGY